MVKRCLIVLALSPLILAGQKTGDSVYDEAAFRKWVEAGLPPEPDGRSTWFALHHQDIAAPILVAAIQSEANQHALETDVFIMAAIALATHFPTEKSIDVAADLYEFNPSRFPRIAAGILT